MGVDIRRFTSVLVCCAAGPVVALMVAGTSGAEPAPPAVPSDPAPSVRAEVGTPVAVAAEGTPHLSSPANLPPGSTMDPTGQGTETPNLSYLKDLWYAVQRHEISGKEALLLGLAQRGMNTPVPDEVPAPGGAPAPPGGPVPPPAP